MPATEASGSPHGRTARFAYLPTHFSSSTRAQRVSEIDRRESQNRTKLAPENPIKPQRGADHWSVGQDSGAQDSRSSEPLLTPTSHDSPHPLRSHAAHSGVRASGLQTGRSLALPHTAGAASESGLSRASCAPIVTAQLRHIHPRSWPQRQHQLLLLSRRTGACPERSRRVSTALSRRTSKSGWTYVSAQLNHRALAEVQFAGNPLHAPAGAGRSEPPASRPPPRRPGQEFG